MALVSPLLRVCSRLHGVFTPLLQRGIVLSEFIYSKHVSDIMLSSSKNLVFPG
jgi:hypothetical protein